MEIHRDTREVVGVDIHKEVEVRLAYTVEQDAHHQVVVVAADDVAVADREGLLVRLLHRELVVG